MPPEKGEKTMTTTTKLLSLMLASAVLTAPAITPAFANWFSRPEANVNLNPGSAPSPTPEQLRAIGDSDYVPGPRYRHVEELPPPDISYLEGRTVFGTNGGRLGYILAADNDAQMIELQTRNGIGVAMPVDLIVDNGTRVTAPTLSRADVIAMARQQTGRTVALNIDLRRYPPRS
jgi:hypothetical protein